MVARSFHDLVKPALLVIAHIRVVYPRYLNLPLIFFFFFIDVIENCYLTLIYLQISFRTTRWQRDAWWRHQMETFSRYWPFVREIHRSPVNSPQKSQWRGALMFTLICVWINSWVNNREAGDLRSHRVHYDVIVMDLLPAGQCVPEELDLWRLRNNNRRRTAANQTKLSRKSNFLWVLCDILTCWKQTPCRPEVRLVRLMIRLRHTFIHRSKAFSNFKLKRWQWCWNFHISAIMTNA